jgi:hypothetical protein
LFGYIRPDKNSLTDEEKEIYISYYCGICRKLRAISGLKGQMLLNFDVTFLALLLAGLYEPDEMTEVRRCNINPLLKRRMTDSPIMDYAASMNILLSYYSLMDKYIDDGSRISRNMAKSIRASADKVFSKYPRQTAAVNNFIKNQREAEERCEKGISAVASLTGIMLGEILCLNDNDYWNDSLKSMGYSLGKFIYVMDAYDDLIRDMKSGNYNVLIDNYLNSPSFEVSLRQYLKTQMADAAAEFERLPVIKNAPVIRNILYSGVWIKYDYINSRRSKSRKKSDRTEK